MKKTTVFPWYIFLLPFFYVLHVYNNFFGIINITLALQFLFYYLLLSITTFAIAWLLFKNSIKAGILTILFLIFYFFFGALHDFLKSLHLPSFITSYSVIFSLVLILFILLTARLRKKNVPVKANRFFLYLSILFCVMETGITLFYIFSNKIKRIDPTGNNPPMNLQLKIKDKNQMPDIFFMVFDEYASSKALKKYNNFDNSQLDSSLLNAGFFISTNSQSNYNATSFSIGSTFNLQYFNRDLEKTPNNIFTWLQGAYSYKNSILPGLLKKNGYYIINHGLCDIKNYPLLIEPFSKDYEINAITLHTLWGRIKRDIYWNITVRLPGYTKKRLADINYINRNRTNYTNFRKELGKETDQPKFVIGHVIIPHNPPVVDRYGRPRMMLDEDYSDKNHNTLYTEQVLFVNKWIDSLAKAAATTPRKRPLVLIIEGDHGDRYSERGRPIREKQFMNLNTYYFSDKDYSMLYDSISPVNSFRVVLNKYFQAGLPLLKDSTIRLTD
ncbi:MAG: sulfatase-like hydrolase/transferase [Chitinophagaceae bacterium]